MKLEQGNDVKPTNATLWMSRFTNVTKYAIPNILTNFFYSKINIFDFRSSNCS